MSIAIDDIKKRLYSVIVAYMSLVTDAEYNRELTEVAYDWLMKDIISTY